MLMVVKSKTAFVGVPFSGIEILSDYFPNALYERKRFSERKKHITDIPSKDSDFPNIIFSLQGSGFIPDDYKVIYIVRNLRSVMVDAFLWAKEHENTYDYMKKLLVTDDIKKQFFLFWASQGRWPVFMLQLRHIHDYEIFQIEDLCSIKNNQKHTDLVTAVKKYLHLNIHDIPFSRIQKTDWREYWSDDIEVYFRERGLGEHNYFWGYETPTQYVCSDLNIPEILCADYRHHNFNQCQFMVDSIKKPYWNNIKNITAEIDCFFSRLKYYIINLRQEIEPEKTWELFEQDLFMNQHIFIEKLSIRWLISILDTYALSCRRPAEREMAFQIANIIKMDAITTNLYGGNVDNLGFFPQYIGQGMNGMNLRRSDTFSNIILRIFLKSQKSNIVHKISVEILKRIVDIDNSSLSLLYRENSRTQQIFNQLFTE